MDEYRIFFDGVHLWVERLDGKEIHENWDFFQHLKNEYFGDEATVVELYPPESEVYNEVNRRHFWSLEYIKRR